MMVVEATTTVRAPLDRVREAVLDPASYTSDTKVAQITVHERSDDRIRATLHGHLGPIHSAIEAEYSIAADRVDLTMLSGRLRGFRAAFLMEERDGATRLTHREEYDFGYGPLGPVLDRVLRRWALTTVVAEVRALRRAAEARAAQSR
jgi:hypothetical protein